MIDAATRLAEVHLAATWFMVGLIWFVQLVHYPGFALVHETAFRGYQERHTERTGWVVAPVMLVEAMTALLLIPYGPADAPGWALWTGLALLAVIWGSTALVQMPLHARLLGAYDRASQRRLVRGNWPRTIAWSARGVIAFVMLAGVR